MLTETTLRKEDHGAWGDVEHSSPEHSKLEAGEAGIQPRKEKPDWSHVVLKGESWKKTRLWRLGS